MKPFFIPLACFAFVLSCPHVFAAPESSGEIIIKGDTGEAGRTVTGRAALLRPLYMGVEIIPVDAPTRALFKLPETGGLLVIGVSPGSPADGKFAQGDILLKLEDQLLVNREQLRSLLRAKKAGDSVTLETVRGGRKESVTVKLAIAPGVLTAGLTPLNLPGFREGRAEALKHQLNDRLKLNDRLRHMLENSGLDDPAIDKALNDATVILGDEEKHEGAEVGGITLNLGGTGFTKITTRSVIRPEGVMTLVERDGKTSVTVKDKSGKTLVDGELNDGLRAKLPDWAKAALDGDHAPAKQPTGLKAKTPAA